MRNIKCILKHIFEKKYKFSTVGENFVWCSGEISDEQNIEIGNNIYIGPGANIHGRGGIIIKDGVIIGPRVTIHSSNHNYYNAHYLPYDGTAILKRVVIEECVWIGDNVMIVPGVTIGEGSVVGMGSVVTKDIPKYSIVGGNPARIIRMRDDIDNYLRLKKEGKLYLKYKAKGMVAFYEKRQY